MAFTYSRKINYYETDMMGVVHHSNYIRYLEEARCAWVDSLGLPMREIEKRGFTIPTIEIICKYKRHVTEGDILAIGINLSEYNGVRMTITYDVRDVKTGDIIVEATSKHCFTNMELKPINIKKYDDEIYTKFEACKLEK